MSIFIKALIGNANHKFGRLSFVQSSKHVKLRTQRHAQWIDDSLAQNEISLPDNTGLFCPDKIYFKLYVSYHILPFGLELLCNRISFNLQCGAKHIYHIEKFVICQRELQSHRFHGI